MATNNAAAFPACSVIAHWKDKDDGLPRSLGTLGGQDGWQDYLVAELDTSLPAINISFTPINLAQDQHTTESVTGSKIKLIVTPTRLSDPNSISTETAVLTSTPAYVQNEVVCLNHIPGQPHGEVSAVARMHLLLERSPTIAMPRRHRIVAHEQDLEYLKMLRSLSNATSITLYALPSCAHDLDTWSVVLQDHDGPCIIGDTRQYYTFSGPATTPWTRYTCQNGYDRPDPRTARTGEKRKAAEISGADEGDDNGGSAEEDRDDKEKTLTEKTAQQKRIKVEDSDDTAAVTATVTPDDPAVDMLKDLSAHLAVNYAKEESVAERWNSTTPPAASSAVPAPPTPFNPDTGPPIDPATAALSASDVVKPNGRGPGTLMYKCWKATLEWVLVGSNCPPEVSFPMLERSFYAQQRGDNEEFARHVKDLMEAVRKYY